MSCGSHVVGHSGVCQVLHLALGWPDSHPPKTGQTLRIKAVNDQRPFEKKYFLTELAGSRTAAL